MAPPRSVATGIHALDESVRARELLLRCSVNAMLIVLCYCFQKAPPCTGAEMQKDAPSFSRQLRYISREHRRLNSGKAEWWAERTFRFGRGGDMSQAVLSYEIVTSFQMNQYLLGCTRTGKAAIIDTGDATASLEKAKSLGLRIEYLLQTHAHIDHIAGLAEIKESFLPDASIHLHPVSGRGSVANLARDLMRCCFVRMLTCVHSFGFWICICASSISHGMKRQIGKQRCLEYRCPSLHPSTPTSTKTMCCLLEISSSESSTRQDIAPGMFASTMSNMASSWEGTCCSAAVWAERTSPCRTRWR